MFYSQSGGECYAERFHPIRGRLRDKTRSLLNLSPVGKVQNISLKHTVMDILGDRIRQTSVTQLALFLGSSWLARACLQHWMMMSSGMVMHCRPVHFVMPGGPGDSCLSVELQRSPPTDRCLCLSAHPSELRRSYLLLV